MDKSHRKAFAYKVIAMFFRTYYRNVYYGIRPVKPAMFTIAHDFIYAKAFLEGRTGKVFKYNTLIRYERDYRKQLILEWESLPAYERAFRKLIWELKREYYRFSDLKELPNRFRNLTKMTND